MMVSVLGYLIVSSEKGSTMQGARPRQRPDVETHLLPDGSCLLYDPRSERGHTVNAAGALVWDYCDGRMTDTQIAEELVDLLPMVPSVRNDTSEFLAQLAEQGLLLVDGDVPNRE
jgi:hypothetical protein